MLGQEFSWFARVSLLQRGHQYIIYGLIEQLMCMTQHDDYVAMTNRTVLLQVGPLLRDKDGQATQNGQASLIG